MMLGQMLWIGILAGATTTIVNFLIARLAVRLTKASLRFAPFTFLPIASGGFGGALGASALYWILSLFFQQPQLIFVAICAIILFASFHLPFRISNHRSPRFAGVTVRIQLTLCLMHTIVAGTSVAALLIYTG